MYQFTKLQLLIKVSQKIREKKYLNERFYF
jgi:hypothetical protein